MLRPHIVLLIPSAPRENMRPPPPRRYPLCKKHSDLQPRSSLRLTHTKPHPDQRRQRSTRIHEPDHWTQAGIIIQIRRGEGDHPKEEIQRHDGHRHDLILVHADRDFAGHGVGEWAETEVVGADDDIGEDDNDVFRCCGESGLGAETADDDEGDQDEAGAGEEVGAAAETVSCEDRCGDSEDL